MSSKNSLQYRLLDDELVEFIADLPEKGQADWLFLAPHPSYPGRWYVDSLHSAFFIDFEEEIGSYRTVSPIRLPAFLEKAKELRYNVAFVEDPTTILERWEHLDDPPIFRLNSDMAVALREKGMVAEAETVERTGLLPFQLQGFNYLRNPDLKSGLAMWSTGVGKTALEAALIKQHLEVDHSHDLVICVVKSNNKVDTQRKLSQLGDIESVIIDGTAEKRIEIYEIVDAVLDYGEPVVIIVNYEKFRNDEAFLAQLVTDRRVVIFWDEMPTKLSNRDTMLYDSVRSVLYHGSRLIKWEKLRPASLRQYDLTASPIENSPIGLINQIRLLDPHVFPTIHAAEKRFVATRNYFSKEPETFKNLEEFGLMIDFMTHQVDKKDPEIAKLFPEIHEITRIIDWDPRDRVVYDKLQALAKQLIADAKGNPELQKLNAFQLMGALQMLCDAPTLIGVSALKRDAFLEALAEASDLDYEKMEKTSSGSEAALMLLNSLTEPLTNDHHTKIKTLKELITEKHIGEKIVVFSKLAGTLQPILTDLFDQWGVSYVVYRGTQKQRLEAKDQFRQDPDIQIFLSSDAGSDSIDLPEASVAIDYDEPLTYARKMQRRNRIHRVNSEHGFVTFYTLRMANSVEDRFAEILDTKEGYHNEIFRGEISDSAVSARMTAGDLYYILTGELDSSSEV